MKAYHGSTQIVSEPLCHLSRPDIDFGMGFYITDIEQQAIDWSRVVASKRNLPPVVNVYEFDKASYLEIAKAKIFTSYDKDWLDFVVDCRQGNSKSYDFDYVEGGVANDRVIDTVRLYILGLYDEAYALRQLAYHKPNNQICLKNQELLNKYFKFIEAR